ncbi:MAG: hypothetical protein ACM3NT_11075 [Methylocystaceae bacterium]
MNRQELKANLVGKAAELGADLCGVAEAAALADAPSGHRPADIMPQAKSIVVLAKRLPREAITNNRLFTMYSRACTTSMAMLDTIALRLSCWLEDQGGRATGIAADDPYTSWDEANLRGMGDLSHRHAAVAAGLGRLGKNALLVTPQYGNRVHLVSILTNLDIEPDQPLKEEICPPECRICIDVCPTGALEGDHQVIQKLCRPRIDHKLPRGYSVYGCWECRRVCPVGRR